MPKKQPNIFLIMTDQHRLSAVGCYGETPCKTPHIDALARDGVRFENTYTVCPVCSPARGSIMTGHYPHSTEINCNVEDMGTSKRNLENTPRLLSNRLRDAGYVLGYTGKWHIGDALRPRDLGFAGQNFTGHGNGGFKYPEYQDYLKENGWEHRVVHNETGPIEAYLEGPLESTVPYFLAGNTISLMNQFHGQDKPFFIWHNNWGPHGPYLAPRAYTDMYRNVDIPEWPNYAWPSRTIPGGHFTKIHPKPESMCWEDWARKIRCYYAFATWIDDQIGQMLRHLEETGMDKNTVVIFTADHGETLGSHGGLTDKGFHHFEETHRIPLIVRFPDKRCASLTVDSFASLADIYPTILELANAATTENDTQGASLLPLVDGKTEGWREHVVTEFNGANSTMITQRTLRWKQYKYGFNGFGADELYDLDLDPWETMNRIDMPGYRKTATEMRRRLFEWMKETHDPAAWLFGANKLPYYDG